MKSMLLCFLAFLATTAFSQQYLIKHDIQSNQTNFFKIKNNDTSKIRDISLKKSSQIMLQVDNYNPFYWNAKVTVFKKPVEEEVGFSQAFNPFSVLAKGLGNFMGTLPQLDLPGSRGTGGSANDQYLNTAALYRENYNRLQALNEQYENIQILKLQLTDLKYDYTKTEAEIKKEARQAVIKTLGTDKLDFAGVISIGKNFSRQISSALDSSVLLKDQLQQQLTTVDEDEEFQGKSFKNIMQMAVSSQKNIINLQQSVKANNNFATDEIAEVSNLYKEIMNANFHFSYVVNGEPDVSELKLEVFPRLEAAATDTLVKYFHVKGKRNIKIRNSLGLAFTHFEENNSRYFIGADSIIGRDKRDLFTPVLSTLIHFYSGRTTGIRWGGAFGFGIPLQGAEKDINFLLGTTAAFGQNEPILITAGISGAKVSKLTNGYTVGAKTTERDATKLTTSAYDLGLFLAVTFNLSNLNINRKTPAN